MRPEPPTPEVLHQRRVALLRGFADDLVSDGKDAGDFQHIENAEALAWHRTFVPAYVGASVPAGLSFLSEMLDYAEPTDVTELHRLVLRSLEGLSLDDAAALRDVLRRMLLDYAREAVQLEVGPFVDAELLAHQARQRGAA